MSDKGNLRRTISIGLGIFVFSLLLLYFSRYHIIGFIIGIILLDVGQQAIHVSNQTRVYALVPSARNRLNTVYMTASFIGTSLGSMLGLWVWDRAQWTGICITGISLIAAAFIIYALTYKRTAKTTVLPSMGD